METIVTQLGELGASGAAVLVIAGLIYGLAGWRLLRYLVVLDALVVAFVLGAILDGWTQAGDWSFAGHLGLSTIMLAMGLPFMAIRYPRAAVAVVAGIVGFLLAQLPVIGMEVPGSIHILLGALGGIAAVASYATLRRHVAIILTGMHGGWLCVAALTALVADPRQFGAPVFHAFRNYDCLFPIAAIAVSVIMIALQTADMERCVKPQDEL